MSAREGISDNVLATLMHELNTPISVIVGYAELIAARSKETATREAALNIKEAAERLRSAVERLAANQKT